MHPHNVSPLVAMGLGHKWTQDPWPCEDVGNVANNCMYSEVKDCKFTINFCSRETVPFFYNCKQSIPYYILYRERLRERGRRVESES